MPAGTYWGNHLASPKGINSDFQKYFLVPRPVTWLHSKYQYTCQNKDSCSICPSHILLSCIRFLGTIRGMIKSSTDSESICYSCYYILCWIPYKSAKYPKWLVTPYIKFKWKMLFYKFQNRVWSLAPAYMISSYSGHFNITVPALSLIHIWRCRRPS